MTSDSGETAIGELARILALEEIGPDLYRGRSLRNEHTRRLFGGQVVAQALAAAQRALGDAIPAHSLHAYFLRPGDPKEPLVFQVHRDLDGNSFTNRRVLALQHGAPILSLSASFQHLEPGLRHAAALPAITPPEVSDPLSPQAETARYAIVTRQLAAFELRVPASGVPGSEAPASQAFWFRLCAPPPPGAGLAQALLAYISDFALITTALLPHGIDLFSPRLQGASLDHAVWFHAAPDWRDWLLYAMASPWAGNARGLALGSIHARDGRLIASVAQEGLMRLRRATA